MTDDERVADARARAINGHELLERLAALPVSTWRYHWESPDVRHLGPMSQDFCAAFGLGHDERRIDMVDANGVLTVAVQALVRQIAALEDEVAALRQQLQGEGHEVGAGREQRWSPMNDERREEPDTEDPEVVVRSSQALTGGLSAMSESDRRTFSAATRLPFRS